MSNLCPNCNSFPLEDYVWWVLAGKKHTSWWCAMCGKKYNWKQPNRLLVLQTGERVEQAKVFKAHAIPQGLCENLINALKLLANQQEDGDGLLQNTVTNLGMGSRKGLTDGLLKFIKVDNDAPWMLAEAEVPEGGSDVTIRESPDELPPRAEEVNTLEGVDRCLTHETGKMVHSLVDQYAFCQALYKGIEGKDWEEIFDSYKEMSKPLGEKKPQDPEGKSLVGRESSQRQEGRV